MLTYTPPVASPLEVPRQSRRRPRPARDRRPRRHGGHVEPPRRGPRGRPRGGALAELVEALDLVGALLPRVAEVAQDLAHVVHLGQLIAVLLRHVVRRAVGARAVAAAADEGKRA